ncbi:MAG: DUF2070 family protein [Thermoplasmata archaeon]
MKKSQEDTVLVHQRDYNLSFFRSPSTYILIPSSLFLSIIMGIFIFGIEVYGIIEAIAIFFLPVLISTLVLPYFPGYQEEMNFRQSAMMSLVSLSMVCFFIILYINFNLKLNTIILISYAIPLSFRYLIFRSVFISPPFLSLPHTYFQSVVAVVFLHIFYPLTTLNILIFVLTSLIGLSAVIAFISIVNKPFIKDFGVSTMDLIRMSFQLYAGKEVGKEGLEKVFKKKSIKSDVNYTIFIFKTEEKNKSIFIVPNIHPGPIKGVAGSALTEILSRDLKGRFRSVFTFHGPSTHVHNPIKKEDCSLLSRDIIRSMKDIDYTNVGTRYITSSDGVNVGGQIFGKGLFLNVSFSPRPTEDIDAPIGEIMSLEVEKKGYSTLGFVDAHNCVKKGAMEVYYPSKRYQSIIESSMKLVDEIKGEEMGTLKMGVAQKNGYDKSEGIAGGGIKVAVFEIDEVKNAHVLIDGNNMIGGWRETIQEEISDLVDASEIFTSDTHEVNTLNKDYNPVGKSIEKDRVLSDVRKLTKAAIKDLEKVSFGVKSGVINNFSIMGPIGSNRFNAVAETIYEMAPMTAALSFAVQSLATTVVIMFL